jgi:hypothetical protein
MRRNHDNGIASPAAGERDGDVQGEEAKEPVVSRYNDHDLSHAHRVFKKPVQQGRRECHE